jgi:hypothetical protein
MIHQPSNPLAEIDNEVTLLDKEGAPAPRPDSAELLRLDIETVRLNDGADLQESRAAASR